MKQIKVVRTIIIEGKADWVRATLNQGYLQEGVTVNFCHGFIYEGERKEEEIEDAK